MTEKIVPFEHSDKCGLWKGKGCDCPRSCWGMMPELLREWEKKPNVKEK